MAIEYIGLDFETSGTDPWGKAAPIQIGLATNYWVYETLIGGWDWNEYEWNEESEAIHEISRARLEDKQPVWKIDIQLSSFLIDMLSSNRMWNVTVGWNVAGFDRQFITRHFPNTNRLLSYRTVDLNALVFSLAGNDEGKFQKIKRASKRYAAERLGTDDEQWHDALYDARAALASFDYLTSEGVRDG